jgi:hypothetical protein
LSRGSHRRRSPTVGFAVGAGARDVEATIVVTVIVDGGENSSLQVPNRDIDFEGVIYHDHLQWMTGWLDPEMNGHLSKIHKTSWSNFADQEASSVYRSTHSLHMLPHHLAPRRLHLHGRGGFTSSGGGGFTSAGMGGDTSSLPRLGGRSRASEPVSAQESSWPQKDSCGHKEMCDC